MAIRRQQYDPNNDPYIRRDEAGRPQQGDAATSMYANNTGKYIGGDRSLAPIHSIDPNAPLDSRNMRFDRPGQTGQTSTWENTCQ